MSGLVEMIDEFNRPPACENFRHPHGNRDAAEPTRTNQKLGDEMKEAVSLLQETSQRLHSICRASHRGSTMCAAPARPDANPAGAPRECPAWPERAPGLHATEGLRICGEVEGNVISATTAWNWALPSRATYAHPVVLGPSKPGGLREWLVLGVRAQSG